MAVQWLGLRASTAGALGLIPGQGTKIPQATQRSKKRELQEENGTRSLVKASLKGRLQ